MKKIFYAIILILSTVACAERAQQPAVHALTSEPSQPPKVESARADKATASTKPVPPTSRHKVHSPQELTELATNAMLKYFDVLIEKSIIGVKDLDRVLTGLREKNTLTCPITEYTRDALSTNLLFYKTFYDLVKRAGQSHAVFDHARMQTWLADKIDSLEENRRERERVHEETRELHRPMRFVPLPAGTFTGITDAKIDGREFTISAGVEIQETPVTQFQWASVMGDNPSTHRESAELTDFSEEVLIDNNFVANKKVVLRANAPVETVSYADVQKFVDKLNVDAKKNNQDCVYALASVDEYQALLQTTLGADWLAKLKTLNTCRDINEREHGQDKVVNYTTCPVASGDYLELVKERRRVWDVIGNVWQWTQDRVSRTFSNTQIQAQLIFGTSYKDKTENETLATLLRPIIDADGKRKNIGLRLVCYKKEIAPHQNSKTYSQDTIVWDKTMEHGDWLWDDTLNTIVFVDDLLKLMIKHKTMYPQDIQHTVDVLLSEVPAYAPDPVKYLRLFKSLHLRDNQIQDLTPLAGLTKLENLYLNNNQIQGLAPLAGLTNLKELWLYNNQIKDLSPLARLTKLEWLYLDNNQIQNLTPLAGLTQDLTLYLDADQRERLKSQIDALPKNIKIE